jgi:hypothetical protein
MSSTVHTDHPMNRPADAKVATAKLLVGKKDDVLSDKIHSWPYFVRVEFIAGLIMMLVLTVWSLAIDAPLEEPADPSVTPNPSKAPWYFLGLQEMLVYFDPWMAGVVLPSLIIVGLMVTPYIDINPRGNGYYTWKERWFAISVFFFGIRGYWTSFVFGGATVGAFFGVIPLVWQAFHKKAKVLKELGLVRYLIVAGLFQMMMLLPLKMLLRWTLNIKYLWVTPWFNL